MFEAAVITSDARQGGFNTVLELRSMPELWPRGCLFATPPTGNKPGAPLSMPRRTEKYADHLQVRRCLVQQTGGSRLVISKTQDSTTISTQQLHGIKKLSDHDG